MTEIAGVGPIEIRVSWITQDSWMKGLLSMDRNKEKILKEGADKLKQLIKEKAYSTGIAERRGKLPESIETYVEGKKVLITTTHLKAYQLEYGETVQGDTKIRSTRAGGWMMIPFTPELRYSDEWEQAIKNKNYDEFEGSFFRAQEVSIRQKPFVAPAVEEFLDRGYAFKIGDRLVDIMWGRP
jgi:hypothetical protein